MVALWLPAVPTSHTINPDNLARLPLAVRVTDRPALARRTRDDDTVCCRFARQGGSPGMRRHSLIFVRLIQSLS